MFVVVFCVAAEQSVEHMFPCFLLARAPIGDNDENRSPSRQAGSINGKQSLGYAQILGDSGDHRLTVTFRSVLDDFIELYVN